MMSWILLLATTALVAGIPPPHPDVLAVELEEDFLPPHQRSRALDNPNLQEVLPYSSLLHHGEKVVYNREAHDVSRKEIYSILTHAGFIRRKHPHYRSYLNEPAVDSKHLIVQDEHDNIDVFSLPILKSQDFLQHL